MLVSSIGASSVIVTLPISRKFVCSSAVDPAWTMRRESCHLTMKYAFRVIAKSLSETLGISLISTPIDTVIGWTGGSSNLKQDDYYQQFALQFLTLPWHNRLEDRLTWPRLSCRECGCGRGCAGRPRRWWRGGILPVVSENLYENILKTGRKVFANISLSQKVWWSLLWRNLIPTIYSTNPQ